MKQYKLPQLAPWVRDKAIELVETHGLINLTRELVATECGFPADSFQHRAGATFAELVDFLKFSGHVGPSVPVTRGRADKGLREKSILAAAVRVAIEHGYQNLQRPGVAEAAGVSDALVSHYFGNLDNLKAEVMRHAVENEVVEVVAQGLGSANDIARAAPLHVKQKAFDYLAKF